MPKLSDVFLSILGNTLQGDQGTPAGREERQVRLAENARANLSTLANLNQNYNTVLPDTQTVNPQGSFQPDSNTASLTGLVPGTTLQPISRSERISYYNPKTSSIGSQVVPLDRGQTGTMTSAPVQLLGQQMNFNKNLFDKYDSDMHTAQIALAGVASRLPKGIGQSLVDSITSGVGIPAEFTQSPEYQANAALIQKFGQQYQEAKQSRDSILNGSGANPGVGSVPKPTATLGYDPLGILGNK